MNWLWISKQSRIILMTHSWRGYNIVIPYHMATLSIYGWWRKLAEIKWQVQSKWGVARYFLLNCVFCHHWDENMLLTPSICYWRDLMFSIFKQLFILKGNTIHQKKSVWPSSAFERTYWLIFHVSLVYPLNCIVWKIEHEDDDTVIFARIVL